MGILEQFYLENKEEADVMLATKRSERATKATQKQPQNVGSGYVPVGAFNRQDDFHAQQQRGTVESSDPRAHLVRLRGRENPARQAMRAQGYVDDILKNYSYMEQQAQKTVDWLNNLRDKDTIAAELLDAKQAAGQAQAHIDPQWETRYLNDADRLQYSGISSHHADDIRRQVNDIHAEKQVADQHVADLENELYWSQYMGYMNLANNADFAEYAGKETAKKREQTGEEFKSRLTAERSKLQTMQNSNFSEEELEEQRAIVAALEAERKYVYLNDEELQIYNYLLAKNGADAADDFLDFMENTMLQREGSEIAKYVKEVESPFWRGVAAVPYGIGAGADQFATGVKQLFSEEELPASAMQYASQEISDSLGKGGKRVYGAATAVGNMLPSVTAGILFGAGVGVAVQGASSAGNAYGQAKREGYSTEQARTYAALVGASEMLLQKFLGGIGALGGVADDVILAKVKALDNAFARVALTGAVKIVSEIGEEELQLVLEPMFRSMVFGEKYQAPTWGEAWETAIITALSTGALEAPGIAGVEINNKKYGDMLLENATAQEIVDRALRYSKPGGNADALAQGLSLDLAAGKEVSGADIGRLYSFLNEEGRGKYFTNEGLPQPQTKQNASPANMAMGETGKVLGDAESALPDTGFAQDATGKTDSQNTNDIGYQAYYEAGLSGATINSVDNIHGKTMTQEQKQEAYDHGRREAAESLLREKADAPLTPSYGNNAKLMPNKYSNRLPKQTRGVLNDLARMTGMNIEIVDMEDGFNGRYNLSTGTMQISSKVKNAALVVAAHEITHRMQQAAPQEYRQYREHVVNAISKKIGRSALEYTMKRYADQGIELTTEEAMDELASDFAMDMVRDGKLFQDLMLQNRTAAQKLVDAVKAFIARVKDWAFYSYETHQDSMAMEHYGVDIKTLERAVKKWEAAMTATRKQVEGKEISARMDGGEERFALVGWTKDGRKVYETDFDTSISEEQRIELFKERIATVFNLGAVNLKTDTKKIVVNGDRFTAQKNLYGDDTKSKDTGEFQAKVNALYDMADILKSAKFESPASIEESYKDPTVPPKNDAHKGVKYWYKFRTNIVMDGVGYKVTFNIRDKGKQQLEYLIEFKKDGTPAVSNTVAKRDLLRSTTDIPANSIRQTNPKSKHQNSVTETESFRASRAKELMDKYGTIYPGENPHRKANVPRKTSGKEFVTQTIRTVIEAEATPDVMVPTLEDLVAEGEFSYERYTDEQAMDDARDTILDLGYNGALAKWMSAVERGKVSKRNTALGWELYRQAANANDTDSAISILNLMVEHQRNAAQALQATRILKKMTPDAQLFGVQKSVSRLRQELKEQFGKKAPNLKIDKGLAEKFLNAETEADQNAALQEMYKDIGQQIPATLKEKWDNWRYLAMLANPRTHIRNIAGNAAFMPVRGLGNQLSAVGQALFLPKEQRTRSLGMNVSQKRRELVTAAKADFDTNAGELVMNGEKWNSADNAIERNKRIYRFKPLEAARKGNGNLLEWEDKIFSKQAYSAALAGYLNAKGYTAQDFTGDGMTQQQKDDARTFAVHEAQRATYRDANAFSDLVSSIGFRKPGNNVFKHGANALIEGVLPFKKTPANVLARAFEYSPAGIVAEAGRAAYDGIANHNFDANKFIDNMSRGLTGSAVMALGYLLAKWGVLKATPEDEEQSELEGRQTYSLEIGGKSITLDWLAPGSMPLFMGAELYDLSDRETGGDAPALSEYVEVFTALTGPMQNMSMLDGLNSTIESAAIAAQNDGSAIGSLFGSAALNYVMQAFPTIAGQIERVLAKNERVRQTTFINKDDPVVGTGMQYTLGRLGNKIPIFDYQQVPYIDAWGRTQGNGNMAERAFDNMLNPAYGSQIVETDVDRELKRLEAATGKNYTPARVKNNELTVNGEKLFLTEEEFITYATAKGQNDLTIRQSIMDSEAYGALDDAAKGTLHDLSEAYADILAKQETGLKPELTGWQEELQDADIDTVVETLISQAVDSRATAIGKEQGGGKYDGLALMLDEGQINDMAAYLSLSETMQDAYGKYAKNGKVFTAEDMIDIYSYAKREGGSSTKGQYQAALNEIERLYPGGKNNDKAIALGNAFGEVFKTYFPKEQEPDAGWQAQYGQAGQKNILANMSDSQKAKYAKYVADTGVSPYQFELALQYKNEEDENQKLLHDKSEVDRYLSTLGLTAAQKQAVMNGLYKQK